MTITEDEKEFAYSVLTHVSRSTNEERRIELKGILKGILIKRYPYKHDEISRIEFDFSNGNIEIV